MTVVEPREGQVHSCSDNNIDPDFLVPNMFWCFIEKTWTAFKISQSSSILNGQEYIFLGLSLLLKQCTLQRGSLSFTCLSTVQIYDFHMFLAVHSSLHGFIWNQHNDQLPVSLLAQLVECCTGIAEVMGSNPVQA